MPEHEGVPPEEQEPFDPSSDDPDRMKAAILAEASASNIIQRGLEADREPEPEEKDERGLTPSDYSALDELGIDRATLKPTRSRPEPPVSEETSELLHQAAERELEWNEGIDAAVRYATRDPESFTLWVEDLLERETEDILETYGAVSIADLANSDSFQELPEDERAAVYQELQDTQAGTLAREVIEEIRQAELPQAQAELADARARERGAAAELWGQTVLNGLGASHLDNEKLGDLFHELDGLQQAMAEGGPELLATMVEGFDPTDWRSLALYSELIVPLSQRAADDPILPEAARALRVLGSRVTGTVESRKVASMKEAILKESGTLPIVDSEREAYLASWDHGSKPVTSMKELADLMKRDPKPARTGNQVARDIKSGARSGGPTSAQIRAHIDAAAKRTEKRNAKEREARGQGVRR